MLSNNILKVIFTTSVLSASLTSMSDLVVENPFSKNLTTISQSENIFIGMLSKDEDIKVARENAIIKKKNRIKARKKRIAQRKLEEKLEQQEDIKRQKMSLRQKSRYVTARVDVSKQQMRVYKNNKLLYTWKVSTGKKGFRTPRGEYNFGHRTKMHYSRQYDNAPMPYAIFFNRGYATHGTKSVSALGRKASHGCVRLHTSNARKLYKLVQQSGKNNADIRIVN